MAKYESQIKQLYSPVEAVYAKISDLNNLAVIRDRFNDPMVQSQMASSGQIPADKIDEIRESLEKFQFDRDSISGPVGPIGNIALSIIEREENKCVKFASTNSPVGFKLWIQVLPTSATTSKMRVTIDADLNFFMKQMFGSKLEQGVDKFADTLAMIPY